MQHKTIYIEAKKLEGLGFVPRSSWWFLGLFGLEDSWGERKGESDPPAFPF